MTRSDIQLVLAWGGFLAVALGYVENLPQGLLFLVFAIPLSLRGFWLMVDEITVNEFTGWRAARSYAVTIATVLISAIPLAMGWI